VADRSRNGNAGDVVPPLLENNTINENNAGVKRLCRVAPRIRFASLYDHALRPKMFLEL
jgi:hypothetical protein